METISLSLTMGITEAMKTEARETKAMKAKDMRTKAMKIKGMKLTEDMKNARSRAKHLAQGHTSRIYIECFSKPDTFPKFVIGAWFAPIMGELRILSDVAELASLIPDYGGWSLVDWKNFERYKITKDTSLTEIALVSAFLNFYPVAGTTLISEFGITMREAEVWIQSRYAGCYESLEDLDTDAPTWLASGAIWIIEEKHTNLISPEKARGRIHIFWTSKDKDMDKHIYSKYVYENTTDTRQYSFSTW